VWITLPLADGFHLSAQPGITFAISAAIVVLG
jgi:hypothetical protein